jgi:hypothetical protein
MKYSPLFTIEIEHDYFSESKPDVFRLVPTSNTELLLSGSGMIAKFLRNKLYVLVKHLEKSAPLLTLSNDFTFQFFLEVIRPDFAEITNLNLDDPYNRKLYLSNGNSILDGSDKSIDNVLYLNEKLPQFNSAKAYRYNDMVRSGSDIAYECLKKIDINTGNLNNTGQFRKLNKVSYITSATSILFTGPTKSVSLKTPAPAVFIKYFQFNSASGLFDIEVKNTLIGTEENPTGINVMSVLLSFYDDANNLLSEGLYKVTINTQEEYFYFRADNNWQQILGIVNIHNNLMAANDSYRILKEDGTFFMIAPANEKIDTRNFKFRFAPSQYLMKYVCKTNKVTSIADEDGVIEFDNLGNNTFQSQLPVRLSEIAPDTISVTYDGSDTLTKMRVPGYRSLSILDDDNDYIISETYLNL